MFKQNGNVFWNSGTFFSAPASTYQYAEIPINLSQVPDTIIIQMQSSSWNDTALSFVGSDFKVDGMFFKSQFAGINNPSANALQQNFVFPNPVHDVLNISVNNNSTLESRVVIYDITGRSIAEEKFTPAGNTHVMNAAQLQPGVYMIELITDKRIMRNRFLKE
jgi:hypothetical protein